jgi:hypothetical protein
MTRDEVKAKVLRIMGSSAERDVAAEMIIDLVEAAVMLADRDCPRCEAERERKRDVAVRLRRERQAPEVGTDLSSSATVALRSATGGTSLLSVSESDQIRSEKSNKRANVDLFGDTVSTEAPTRRTKYPTPAYSADFLAFWALYPRREAKGDAWKAWEQVRPPIEAVRAALTWQVKRPQWLEGPAFIPLPATWLRARRWEDERTSPAVSALGQYRKLG